MAAVSDGESTPFGGAKGGAAPRKARKTSARKPPPKGPKRSGTVVMENPEIAPASPAPPQKSRTKTSSSAKARAPRRKPSTARMVAVKPEPIAPMVGKAPPPPPDDDDDDDDVPTRSKSHDWANPGLANPGLDEPSAQADDGGPTSETPTDEFSPTPPSAEDGLMDLAPLSDEDFPFSVAEPDSESDADPEDDDPDGRRPTEKELPAITAGQSVTLVNGVNPSQRVRAEVDRVTERHLYLLVDGETRRISRDAGFEHPEGGSWSAWRLSGEDHKHWRPKS